MSAFTWPSLSVVGSKTPYHTKEAEPFWESEDFGRNTHSNQTGTRGWPGRAVAWLTVGFFVVLLAFESTAVFSSQHTSAPLHRLLSLVFGSRVDADWSLLHHLIRKTGHFLGYGVFGLLCHRAWKQSYCRWSEGLKGGRRTPWLILCPAAFGILATVVAASLDELHQRFVPGRSGALTDVLLDVSGAIALQLCRAGFRSLRRSLISTISRSGRAQKCVDDSSRTLSTASS